MKRRIDNAVLLVVGLWLVAGPFAVEVLRRVTEHGRRTGGRR